MPERSLPARSVNILYTVRVYLLWAEGYAGEEGAPQVVHILYEYTCCGRKAMPVRRVPPRRKMRDMVKRMM